MSNNIKGDTPHHRNDNRNCSQIENDVYIEEYQQYIKSMIDHIHNEKKLKSIYRLTLKYYSNG